MVVTVCCALSSYVLLGTALQEMAEAVVQSGRQGWPFDITVEGYLSDTEISQIQAMSGVSRVELAHSAMVFVGPASQEVISMETTGTAFILEFSEGRLPQNALEVAIPEALANALGLDIGDRIRMTARIEGSDPQEYEVSGILSGKAGVLTLPVLTSEGIARVDSSGQPNRTLIQLDGTVDLDRFGRSLSRIVGDAQVRLATDTYASVEEMRSMSDSLVIALRLLILLITAASLVVLFYMSQRGGAYETGVLRAVGVRREWLLLPAIGAALVIFAIGLPLTALLLPVLASGLGLHTDPVVLRSVMTRDMVIYVVVGLLSTLVVNVHFLHIPVPRLLKDSW